jgi:hypothetical protein
MHKKIYLNFQEQIKIREDKFFCLNINQLISALFSKSHFFQYVFSFAKISLTGSKFLEKLTFTGQFLKLFMLRSANFMKNKCGRRKI